MCLDLVPPPPPFVATSKLQNPQFTFLFNLVFTSVVAVERIRGGIMWTAPRYNASLCVSVCLCVCVCVRSGTFLLCMLVAFCVYFMPRCPVGVCFAVLWSAWFVC